MHLICRILRRSLSDPEQFWDLRVANNQDIEAGAKAVTEDKRLPGWRLEKLARVVADHMDWFDAAAARGTTWQDTERGLATAGATGKDGKPLRIGKLFSTVWRERIKVQSAKVPSRGDRPNSPGAEPTAERTRHYRALGIGNS